MIGRLAPANDAERDLGVSLANVAQAAAHRVKTVPACIRAGGFPPLIDLAASLSSLAAMPAAA